MTFASGTICSLRVDRGFGFIRVTGQPDLFFHIKDLVDLDFDETLMERRVTFNEISTDRGQRATYVRAVF